MLIKVTMKDCNVKAPKEVSNNKNKEKADLVIILMFIAYLESIGSYHFFSDKCIL